MKSKFIGGPFDGLELDTEQVNRYCMIWSRPHIGKNRLILIVPSEDDRRRIDSGEASKDELQSLADKLAMYERHIHPDGKVEFRFITDP